MERRGGLLVCRMSGRPREILCVYNGKLQAIREASTTSWVDVVRNGLVSVFTYFSTALLCDGCMAVAHDNRAIFQLGRVPSICVCVSVRECAYVRNWMHVQQLDCESSPMTRRRRQSFIGFS